MIIEEIRCHFKQVVECQLLQVCPPIFGCGEIEAARLDLWNATIAEEEEGGMVGGWSERIFDL